MIRTVDCSVCIANYNGMDVIDDCLRSVLDQKCDFSYEIIVHDDASTDGSADYIASHYPQVRLIRGDQNAGYCISNNRMADQARGRFLLLLNNDAALFPDALLTLYIEATREPENAVLSLPQFNAETGALVDRGLLLDPFLNPLPNLDPARTEVSTVHGACLWIPKDLWREIGGFPDWFHMLAEDLYLCCVTRLWGGKVVVPTRSGYRHRIGYSIGGGKSQGANLVSTFRRRALSERNKNFVMLLCYPLPALWLVMPLHTILLLVEGIILALFRHNVKILWGIYLASMTSIWSHRKVLSDGRCAVREKRTITSTMFFSTFTWFPYKLSLLRRYGLPRIYG